MIDLEIVATAARTPVGLTAESSAAAVRAGISRLREFPFVTPQGEPQIVAADPLLEDGMEGRARLRPMLEGVIDEVRAKLGAIDLSAKGSCDVFVAVPEARPGFSNVDAEWVGRATEELLRSREIDARVIVGGRGHAGAMACVERVAAIAAQRLAPIYLVIGLDSYVDVATFCWLEARRQLAQLSTPNGFVPGEAAACLVLATRGTRRQLRMPCLARIVGVGNAREPLLRDSETGSFGKGMSEAVLRAGAGLSLPGDGADAVYCDINGERYRSEEWGFFAMRAHHTMRGLAYEAPSSSWGDVGAAFGALGAILATQAFVRGYASGPRALVMAGSESGSRGAMFLQAPGDGAGREGGAS